MSNKYSNAKNARCFSCGGIYPHKGQCPASGKECHSCGKKNHFAKFCTMRNKSGKFKPKLNTKNDSINEIVKDKKLDSTR